MKRDTIGAFPLHGMVRFGTARYGTVQLSSGRFAFPLQFSIAIEWAGLFTRRGINHLSFSRDSLRARTIIHILYSLEVHLFDQIVFN